MTIITKIQLLYGIHHVQLAIPENSEAKAEAFYSGILQLDRIAKPEHLARRGGCWFCGEDIELHFGVEKSFHPARKAHLALLTRDLQALQEHLGKKLAIWSVRTLLPLSSTHNFRFHLFCR